MTGKDLTTQRMQDVNLQAATSRYQHRLPQLPPDLNKKVLERAASQPRRVPLLWRWTAVAACLAAVFVVGYTFYRQEDATLAKGETPNGTETKGMVVPPVAQPAMPQEPMMAKSEQPPSAPAQKKVAVPRPLGKEATVPTRKEEPPTKDVTSPTVGQLGAEGFHYASIDTEDDKPQPPLAVTDLHLMEEFIDKMAAYLGVEKQVLDCPPSDESDAVGVGYVFPQKEDFDLFGRLLQVACRYDNTLPDYSLHFSQEQFLFELKDPLDGQKYIWFAERHGRKILLYGSHASVGSPFSATCYQTFRDANVNQSFSYHL